MTRERVKSADQLRGGDRVEVDSGVGPVVVIDVICFTGLCWHGVVASVTGVLMTIHCEPVSSASVGRRIYIAPDAYAAGEVFIRRRSVEELQRNSHKKGTSGEPDSGGLPEPASIRVREWGRRPGGGPAAVDAGSASPLQSRSGGGR